MVTAHAATMNGASAWEFVAAVTATGATLIVKAPQADVGKLKGLGFIGVLTEGMHHQTCCWSAPRMIESARAAISNLYAGHRCFTLSIDIIDR